MCGFLKYLGCETSIQAKLWAIHRNLHLTMNRHIRKLEIEIDLKLIYLFSHANLLTNHLDYILISNCRCLLSSFEESKIMDVGREGNL